jgi:hypothetical protein
VLLLINIHYKKRKEKPTMEGKCRKLEVDGKLLSMLLHVCSWLDSFILALVPQYRGARRRIDSGIVDSKS